MTIYGRFGNPITIVRMGTLDDVEQLDKRKPDEVDRASIANGSYLVCRDDDNAEWLQHLGYLRADGGIAEIYDAIRIATGEDPRDARVPGPGGPGRKPSSGKPSSRKGRKPSR